MTQEPSPAKSPLVALHLIPVPLSALNCADPTHSLPANLIVLIRELRHFVVENAKSARVFLKSVDMPVPIADLNITELPDEANWVNPAPFRMNWMPCWPHWHTNNL